MCSSRHDEYRLGYIFCSFVAVFVIVQFEFVPCKECVDVLLLIYVGNSISKVQIQVANYVFELSAVNSHR
jgi:hypothetical protein